MTALPTAFLFAAVNFFPNPGFETWGSASGYPTDEAGRWRVQHSGKDGFTVLEQSRAERHSGAASLHVRDANGGSFNHALACRLGHGCAVATRGKVLRASCWAKVVASSSEKQLNLMLAAGGGKSGKGASAAVSPVAFGTDGWVRVTTKVRVPDDANSVTLTFNCANGWGETGEAYFDDVVVSTDPAEHGAEGYVAATNRPLHALAWRPAGADTAEEAAYRRSYRDQPPCADDGGRGRPEISGGNFTVNGKPQHYLGVWVYNRTRIDWPANPLGIDHIAYREPPGTNVFAAMGFNSAQVSAAHAQIGAAVRGFPLLKPTKHWDKYDWRADEREIAAYFRRFGDTPLILDFAFGYAGRYPKEMRRQLDQRKDSWHEFIPFCPECPEGERYYADYFLGGARAALRHGSNVFVYELFNESSYGCECRYNYEEFVRRMKLRFGGDVAKANARWGTVFDGWDDLLHQSDYRQFPGVWYDWCRFLGERYAETLERGKALIRGIDRRRNVYFTEQEAGAPVTKETMDYRRVADALDVLALEGGWGYGFRRAYTAKDEMEGVVATGGSSHYYNCDWYQALAKGRKPVVNDEHYCTRIEGGERVPSKKSDFITSLWLEVMHGVSANYTYVWDKRHWEAQTLEQAHENVRKPSYKSSSLLNPWNVRPEDLSAFKEFRDEFEPFREMVMPFPRVKAATVGVVFAKATEIHKTHLPRVKPSRPIPCYVNARDLVMGDWYAAVLHAPYPTRVVFAEDLARGEAEGLEALVFPDADAIEPEAVRAARVFAQRGGLVVAPASAFRFDQFLRPLAEDVSFVTRVADAAAAVAALGARKVTRYAALEPTDGSPRPFTGVDVQVCDRGARKLVCLADLDNPVPRPARLRLTLGASDAARLFRVTDVVAKRALAKVDGSRKWSPADLAAGIPLVVPPQERALVLLEETAP